SHLAPELRNDPPPSTSEPECQASTGNIQAKGSMTGPQMEAFRDALAAAYNLSSLDQMLLYRLDRHRSRIVASDDLNRVLFNVIVAAEREGWLDDLVTAASEYNPANPLLRAFVASYRDANCNSGRDKHEAET